jgi:hypothetical protein
VLVVGLARPVTTIKTPRREATVVLAVDVSNSMAATDIKPTRLTAAKAAADAFVARQSSGVKIGVVAFGNGAIVVQTPTTAHSDAIKAIDRLSIGGGTSVGQGLLTSLDAIAGKQLTINEQDLGNDAGRVDIGYYGSDGRPDQWIFGGDCPRSSPSPAGRHAHQRLLPFCKRHRRADRSNPVDRPQVQDRLRAHRGHRAVRHDRRGVACPRRGPIGPLAGEVGMT